MPIKSRDMDTDFIAQVKALGRETISVCYQCGTCTGSCPVGRITPFRIRRVMRKTMFGLKNELLPSDDIWLCTTCYTCFERCPRDINVPAIIMALRNFAVKEGYMADAHKRVANNILSIGHSVDFTDEHKEKRKKLGLDAVPPTTLKIKEAMDEVKKIMEAKGFNKLVGE